jgi:hypothetical protein
MYIYIYMYMQQASCREGREGKVGYCLHFSICHYGPDHSVAKVSDIGWREVWGLKPYRAGYRSMYSKSLEG